ncbi:hypothetical protein [Nonomuraea maritima]|uniref:hypothetical protein n=1 Tax=Nonomuraea maritima TaxID=683260 RepID=UPI0037125EB6
MKAAVIILGCVAIIALAAVLIVWMRTRIQGARQDRRDLAAHKHLLDEIRVVAQQAEALDPSAALIAEKIRAFHTPHRKKTPR